MFTTISGEYDNDPIWSISRFCTSQSDHYHHPREVQCFGQISEVFQAILPHFVQREHVSLWTLPFLLIPKLTSNVPPAKKDTKAPTFKKQMPQVFEHPPNKNKSDMEKKQKNTPWKLKVDAESFWPSQKGKENVFQASFLRGKLAVKLRGRNLLPPRKANMTMENPPWKNMYCLSSNGDFPMSPEFLKGCNFWCNSISSDLRIVPLKSWDLTLKCNAVPAARP